MNDSPSREDQNRRADQTRRVQAFVELWDRGSGTAGQEPTLTEFVSAAPQLSADELAELARIDQRRRWDQNDFVAAEEYLEKFPLIGSDPSAVVDLVFGEYLLLEQRGENPSEREFTTRFPEHAAALAAQIQFHKLTAADDGRQTRAARAADQDQTSDGYPHLESNVTHSLPTRFGRYEIVQLLGRGGMGEVYLARDSLLEREVALKIPRFDRQEREAIERFQREARLAARFTHPNLCAVYDVGQIGGVHYLSLAYIKGETLVTCLAREKPLPVARAVQLTVQIAQAVAEAHRAGIVHRDLKPGNVLLNERGEPVVTDFGLARRVVPSDGQLTSAGAVVGTPAYSAPEQLAGETQLGPAVDVYSLCVILFEMLTGRLPFEGSAGLMISSAIHDPPPSPSTFRTDLDPELEQIVLKGLAKDPAARWPGMPELAAALTAAVSRPPRSPPPRPPASAPATRGQQKPAQKLTGVLAIASAAIVLGLCYVAWQIAQPPAHAPASGNPVQPTGQPPLVTSVAPASERDLLAELSSSERTLPAGWQRQGSSLVSAKNVTVNNLKWDGRLPSAYRIDCEFTTIAPDDALYWVLPVGSRHCLFGFSTYPLNDRVWHGFGSISALPVNTNATGQRVPKSKAGIKFRLQINVRVTDDSATLSAQLNDDAPITWQGPVAELSVPPSFLWPETEQFGIGTVNAAYRIDSLKLTPLDQLPP